MNIVFSGVGPAAELNSPSVEASGRWAALLIRLTSRSRHRRDPALSQRYPSVDAYLRKAPAFAQPIVEHLREVVHAACPEVEECIKWTCPFFVYCGLSIGARAWARS